MRLQLRTVILLGTGLLLAFLTAELNHYLAPFHVSLYAGGLALTFPLLRLRYKQGLYVACALALFYDSTAPVPFGTSLILFLVAHSTIYALRAHFRREEPSAALAVALILNGLLFLTFSLLLVPDTPETSLYWRRVAVDGILSETAVLLVGGWYFALQNDALRFFGIHLDQEQRQAE